MSSMDSELRIRDKPYRLMSEVRQYIQIFQKQNLLSRKLTGGYEELLLGFGKQQILLVSREDDLHLSWRRVHSGGLGFSASLGQSTPKEFTN